jgi:hypothetical protein
MVFIETTIFTKHVGRYLTDDEYLGLQMFLLERPDAGHIIRGTGGVRKLRWAVAGKGKSSGVRIIYYWHVSRDNIWMLTIYSKSERETIPTHILRRIAEEINYD